MRVLITGGAGFIGSNLAVGLADRHPGWEIVAADNLFRRGSELNLPRLQEAGVAFEHADVRQPTDLVRLGEFDAIVEGAAEPSVGAEGQSGGRSLVLDTNLLGMRNCLELAARSGSQIVLLSTSRVYPLRGLEALRYEEGETRFELADDQSLPGASGAGIAEDFPLEGARTLYGTSKLAGELLAGEYSHSHGLAVTVNRCGVIAGPWQLARSDQGVFAHWMLSFQRGRKLDYIGFGGSGKQVRDLLHVADLLELIDLQLTDPDEWAGAVFNVGGGLESSLSLLEASAVCAELTGSDLEVGSVAETRPGDVPIYISDCRRLFAHTDWRPSRTPREILADILAWIEENQRELAIL